jgi:Thermostable hemolysin
MKNMTFIEIQQDHDLLPAACRFIRAAYVLKYDAYIANIPNRLVAFADSNDKIHAAAGLRDFTEPFFSEFYLDQPIEAIIGSVARKHVERRNIVEVSCLVSRNPALSMPFLRALVAHAEELGFDWAFFTATKRLETLLRRMRLPLLSLGEASASRVPSPELWGTYYETQPRVLACAREQLLPFLLTKPACGRVQEARAHG